MKYAILVLSVFLMFSREAFAKGEIATVSGKVKSVVFTAEKITIVMSSVAIDGPTAGENGFHSAAEIPNVPVAEEVTITYTLDSKDSDLAAYWQINARALSHAKGRTIKFQTSGFLPVVTGGSMNALSTQVLWIVNDKGSILGNLKDAAVGHF